MQYMARPTFATVIALTACAGSESTSDSARMADSIAAVATRDESRGDHGHVHA